MTKTHDRPAYARIMKDLQTYFPSPKHNPIMDGYFVHTISHLLDRVEEVTESLADYCAGENIVIDVY